MAEPVSPVDVQVVFAQTGQVWSWQGDLPAGSTVIEAVRVSGFCREYPHVPVTEGGLAVFGRRVKPGQVLRDGDRVEICRPLHLDPMEARRQRAQNRD